LVYRNYKALELNLRVPQKRKKLKRDNPNTIAAKEVNEVGPPMGLVIRFSK
jgi:hypothetical protein